MPNECLICGEPLVFTQKAQEKEWQFSPLDAALVGMVNSGSWLYNNHLDTDRLKESLAETLQHYPIFEGRITAQNAISINHTGVQFDVTTHAKYKYSTLAQHILLPKDLQIPFDIKACKKGNFPIMCVHVTYIQGGTLITVAVNHVCADGATLYRFVSDWSKIYNGESVTPVVIDQELFPNPIHTKEELCKILEEKKWYKVELKNVWSMLFDHVRCRLKIGQPILIPYATLNRYREQYNIDQAIGNHAVICALLSRLICNTTKAEHQKCSVASVVNLRGRAVYPESFVGNAVMNVTSEAFDSADGLAQNTALIQQNLKKDLQKETLAAQFQLYTEAMTYKVPFIPFNLGGTYGKHPSCLLINNFCSFPLYDIHFGDAAPERVYPNDLPDQIKLWPGNEREQGIYLLLRGRLAKHLIDIDNLL